MVTCLTFFITLMRQFCWGIWTYICAGVGFVAWMLTPFSLQILSTTLHQLINRQTPEYVQIPWYILGYSLFYLEEIKITQTSTSRNWSIWIFKACFWCILPHCLPERLHQCTLLSCICKFHFTAPTTTVHASTWEPSTEPGMWESFDKYWLM